MFNNLRITTAQTFVLHSLVSLLLGAITSGVTVAGQAIFQTGANPQVIVGTGIAAFLAWFTHGFISLRSSPQTILAATDTSAQFGQIEHDMLAGLDAKVTALTGNHADLVATVNALYQQVAQSPQAAQLAAIVTEAVTSRVQAALPSLIAQNRATPLPAPSAPIANFSQAQREPAPIVLQPRQQSVAPASQGWTTNANPPVPMPQLPFPSSPNTTGSASATNTISFGDTGIVPTVK